MGSRCRHVHVGTTEPDYPSRVDESWRAASGTGVVDFLARVADSAGVFSGRRKRVIRRDSKPEVPRRIARPGAVAEQLQTGVVCPAVLCEGRAKSGVSALGTYFPLHPTTRRSRKGRQSVTESLLRVPAQSSPRSEAM